MRVHEFIREVGDVEISDIFGSIVVKSGPFTLRDFDNNEEIYRSYLVMMDLAKQWDEELIANVDENNGHYCQF